MQVKNNAYGPNLPLNADGKKFNMGCLPILCREHSTEHTVRVRVLSFQ